jgi:hypothetical protein
VSLRLLCHPCVEDDERLPIRVGVNGHNDVTRRGLGNHNTKSCLDTYDSSYVLFPPLSTKRGPAVRRPFRIFRLYTFLTSQSIPQWQLPDIWTCGIHVSLLHVSLCRSRCSPCSHRLRRDARLPPLRDETFGVTHRHRLYVYFNPLVAVGLDYCGGYTFCDKRRGSILDAGA